MATSKYISRGWLRNLRTQNQMAILTGSQEHYVLYDKFHQANTKDPQDVLRRIQVVPELQATLNSQVAEQLFASL